MLPLEVRQHLEKYWQLSVQFFEEGDFALAAFFGITLIEEVGKVVILGNKELGAELDRKGFYNHRKKYAYAVYATLLANSRVARIYNDKERQFAKWFRDGELFSIRNHAIYMELTKDGIVVLNQALFKEVAFLLVCFAGEAYAEIQGSFTGTGPTEWHRILREIDAFRERNSMYQ